MLGSNIFNKKDEHQFVFFFCSNVTFFLFLRKYKKKLAKFPIISYLCGLII